jgi:hypothetical protein
MARPFVPTRKARMSVATVGPVGPSHDQPTMARPAEGFQRAAELLGVLAVLVVRGRIELPTWGL